MRKWFIATLFGTPRRCAFWAKTQRPGAITGYLCHTSSVYQYLRENDATLGEDAMAAVSTA
jgi:hypothetical protein